MKFEVVTGMMMMMIMPTTKMILFLITLLPPVQVQEGTRE
jgi:hypothetical protein